MHTNTLFIFATFFLFSHAHAADQAAKLNNMTDFAMLVFNAVRDKEGEDALKNELQFYVSSYSQYCITHTCTRNDTSDLARTVFEIITKSPVQVPVDSHEGVLIGTGNINLMLTDAQTVHLSFMLKPDQVFMQKHFGNNTN